MENKKRIYLLLAAIIVIMLIVEAIFAHPHHNMPWNTVPGADAAIGFCGAWALILAAKKIIAAILQRRTDYYDGDGGGKDA